jgi:hypothetical protein
VRGPAAGPAGHGASAVPLFGNTRRNSTGSRIVSNGAIWSVGGTSAAASSVNPQQHYAVDDGRGGFRASGSVAPLYSASFFANVDDPLLDREIHERRIALALDVDTLGRLVSPERSVSGRGLIWRDNQWIKEGVTSGKFSGLFKLRAKRLGNTSPVKPRKAVPVVPFRVLDAPSLRDDYYCSVLAYSDIVKVLAVGLGNTVYF